MTVETPRRNVQTRRHWMSRFALLIASYLLLCVAAKAGVLRGKVVFAGRELAGVQVTAHSGDKTQSVISDDSGTFQFTNLADGKWQIEATLQCFESLHADVDVNAAAAPLQLEMKLLPAEKLVSLAEQATPVTGNPPEQHAAQDAGTQTGTAARSKDAAAQQLPAVPPHEENEQGADGFLIQGSVNNAGTSAFSTSPAFGNMRAGKHDLYSGNLQITYGNSALNAQPYSLSGVSVPRPEMNNVAGSVEGQGPLHLPRPMTRSPNISVSYNWLRTDNAPTMNGIVPTAAERTGNLAGLTNALGQPVTIYDPVTGSAYAGNQIPISTEAVALLKLIPLPNLASAAQYNYQAQVFSPSRGDGVFLSLDQRTKHAGSFYGSLGLHSMSSDNTNLFGFLDKTNTMNTHAGIGWGNWYQELGMYAHANSLLSGLT